jgi:hypothetical protein
MWWQRYLLCLVGLAISTVGIILSDLVPVWLAASIRGMGIGLFYASVAACLYASFSGKKAEPRPAKCKGCGYDLSGLPQSAACPECGRNDSPIVISYDKKP